MDQTPAVTVTAAVSNTHADDPYATFLAEQKKREVIWSANRASKRTKIAETDTQQSQCNISAMPSMLPDNSSVTTKPSTAETSVATQTPESITVDVATQTASLAVQPSQSDELKVSAYPKSPHCVSTALLTYVYKKTPAKYIFSESLIIEDY